MTPEELAEAVYTALGEASMCWRPTPIGVFQSERAREIGEELIRKIKGEQ